jgi:low temperature requirement protein LtrA
VTAVETFFDVVFVFTLTQLTRTLGESLTLATGARILLVFGALWYMYGGYAWLTNHVPPRRTGQKLALFVAMAASSSRPSPFRAPSPAAAYSSPPATWW